MENQSGMETTKKLEIGGTQILMESIADYP